MIIAPCPVCGGSVAAPFFDGGRQPLATLGWPASAAEAQAMTRHPLDFVQCPHCSHVWNRAFTYEAIPYQAHPNRMFNQGGLWQGHLAETRDRLLARLPPAPVVVDIGCGEGHFVRGLAQACGGAGRFLGFDPSSAPQTGNGLEFHARYFAPLDDMPRFAPDAVVLRHVLEHLSDPAALLEQLAWGAAALTSPCWLFAEVPCIDRVAGSGRLADFFYEHVSHFTTTSFRTAMARAGEVVELAHGYDGEVVHALVRLQVPAAMRRQAAASDAFAVRVDSHRAAIRAHIDALAASGRRIAIWGGTGKAAAFIHQFGLDATRFPLVVDSDPDKTGTFVPGSGQQILSREALRQQPADVVIIPTQWRAKDIVAEMQREAIPVRTVLIEHGGALVDFMTGSHPYL